MTGGRGGGSAAVSAARRFAQGRWTPPRGTAGGRRLVRARGRHRHPTRLCRRRHRRRRCHHQGARATQGGDAIGVISTPARTARGGGCGEEEEDDRTATGATSHCQTFLLSPPSPRVLGEVGETTSTLVASRTKIWGEGDMEHQGRATSPPPTQQSGITGVCWSANVTII
jgi:hypothetical protein